MDSYLANRRLYPVQVITVYSDKAGYQFYLENRDIKTIKGKATLMAPVALADDVLKSIARSYTQNNSFVMEMGGEIAPHLLYAINRPGKTVVVWHRPAMKKSLNFSASLKIKGDSYVTVPATLNIVIDNELFIYALMDDSRPTNATKLYNAPFFNIYDNGRVCLGTAHVGKIKAKTFEKEADRFERAFYMAEQNGGNSSNNCKTPLPDLWNRLIKKPSAFPSKTELIQHTKYKTFGDLLKNLVGNQNIDDED